MAGRNPLLPELLALPAPEAASPAELADGDAHAAGDAAAPAVLDTTAVASVEAGQANGTGAALTTVDPL